MWKAILSLLLFVGLSGFCSAETISSTRGDPYKYLCTSHNGVSYTRVTNDIGVGVVCNDGYWDSVAWQDTASCPSGYTMTTDKNYCISNLPDPDSVCSTILANNSQSDRTKWTFPLFGQPVDYNNPNPCDSMNQYPSNQSQLPPGVGCQAEGTWGMGKQTTVTYEYSGKACVYDKTAYSNYNSGKTIDNTADNMACPSGTTSGQINGKNACVSNVPTPSSGQPVVTSDGKDANGNCAAGYTGSIDANNNFVCTATPPTDTSKNPPTCATSNCTNNTNAPCPDGYSSVTVGGGTYCTKFTSTSSSSSSSSSSGSSGSSGTGSGNASAPSSGGSGNGSGNGDGSCSYTGLLSFMCTDGPPSPNLDTSGLKSGVGGDLSTMLDQSDQIFSNSSCPPDIQIPINTPYYSFTISVPYIFLCSLATYIKPLLMIISMVGAAFIIFKRG